MVYGALKDGSLEPSTLHNAAFWLLTAVFVKFSFLQRQFSSFHGAWTEASQYCPKSFLAKTS